MTKIEWAEKVWNPLVGCTYASPGCTNCYAVDQAWIRSHNPDPRIQAKFAGTVAKSEKGHRHWTGQINFDEAALLAPLRWKKPARIFVNSMSDLFHENVPDEQIDRIFAVMALCPQHTFQVLTKRSDRMREYLTHPDVQIRIDSEMGWIIDDVVDPLDRRSDDLRAIAPDLDETWPLPNVWLGVSVENQQAADERIPHLLATPAALRWISAEPLLGPVDLTRIPVLGASGDALDRKPLADCTLAETKSVFEGAAIVNPTLDCLRLHDWLAGYNMGQSRIDWVVTGGESGKDARGSCAEVEANMRDQCAAAGVAFFGKQNFRKKPLPNDLLVREYPDAR